MFIFSDDHAYQAVSAYGGGLNFWEGVSMWKGASSSDLSNASEIIQYSLWHGNGGDVGQDVANYVVEDIFPTELKLIEFTVGDFPGTTQKVNVYYQSKTKPWTLWPSGPWDTDSDNTFINVSELALAPGDHVTGLRFDFGNVPGGGSFHPQAPGITGIRMNLEAVDYSSLVFGSSIQNCATTTGTNAYDLSELYSSTYCVDIDVDSPRPVFRFWTYDVSYSTTPPYQPGDTLRQSILLGMDSNSSFPIVRTSAFTVRPPTFRYSSLRARGLSGGTVPRSHHPGSHRFLPLKSPLGLDCPSFCFS